jgi:translation elongation factor EF-Tu-like GTPase
MVLDMADLDPHIEVEITLLPTEQSGRRAPIFTGFHSSLEYDGRQGDAIHTLEQREFAFPGEQVRALLTFRHPEWHADRMESGKTFRVRDGETVIGHGTVRRVLPRVVA